MRLSANDNFYYLNMDYIIALAKAVDISLQIYHDSDTLFKYMCNTLPRVSL